MTDQELGILPLDSVLSQSQNNCDLDTPAPCRSRGAAVAGILPRDITVWQKCNVESRARKRRLSKCEAVAIGIAEKLSGLGFGPNDSGPPIEELMSRMDEIHTLAASNLPHSGENAVKLCICCKQAGFEWGWAEPQAARAAIRFHPRRVMDQLLRGLGHDVPSGNADEICSLADKPNLTSTLILRTER